jgi:hypothetical protein
MRLRLLVGGAVLALALVGGGAAGAAMATDPVDLGSSHVVDDSNVLGGKTAEVNDAISTLYKDHKIDLYVVYVPTFTNPADRESWANQTANDNNLGPRDYLLAVATQGRAYYLSADSSGPVSNDQISQIEANDIEPALKNGDWAGAAVATAKGLGDATGGGGGGSALVWIIVIILVIVAIIVIVLVLRSRSKANGKSGAGSPIDELMAMPIKDLERRAGSALVQTDDVIRTSEDELGFAVAQYGADAAAPFQTALDDAKSKLSEAFRLKQKLDDSEPDTEQETREWNAGIVRLCDEANAALDAQAKSFDELRKLEKNIPDASAAVQKQAAGAEERIQGATATLASLSAKYTDASLSTVSDNVAQAQERLTFASTALAAAQQKDQDGDTSEAAVGVRAAEDAVTQAGLLLDAIDRVSADLTNAQNGIDAALADLQQDIADAKGFAAADTGGAIAAAANSAEQAVTAVQGRLAGGKVNPLEIAQVLQAANQNIDGVLGAVRDKQAQDQRALASIDQVLMSAQSKVSAATDFITARRGAVGAEARTRLAEAGRLVVLARRTAQTDPSGGLAQAQRADQLADEAIQLAQQDVGGFGGGMSGGTGGMFGGGNSGGGGELGAVLGGILIGGMLGGGGNNNGGMFGGGGGGGMFGGGGGGGGGMFGGGAGPGSFGGGGTRSRRGGGRF